MGRLLQSIGLIAAIGVVGLALAPASGAPRAIHTTGSLLVPAKCSYSGCAKWEWVWAPGGRYKVKKCKWKVITCEPDR
jgi:hypothetical protein